MIPTRTDSSDRPGRRARLLPAVALCAALALGACGGGGDDTEATPTTAGGPTTSSGPAGPLPNLCDLITDEEMAEATGKEIGKHYPADNQCIYVEPDEKTLVGSVMAHRPGLVDFDDLRNTRGVKSTDEIDGHPTVFHPQFVIAAALKDDKFVAAQLTIEDRNNEDDVERATRTLLEKAVARA